LTRDSRTAAAPLRPFGLADLLEKPAPKRWRAGTHRTCPPAETLARLRPLMGRMGITRLGNITGLDRIGIPVAVAVRPNSRSVSVSQGKGFDREQAMASALMEACEGFHAEEIGPVRTASYRELAARETVVDPAALPAAGRPFDERVAIAWSPGWDLLRAEPCRVPAELVHTDYTGEPDGFFLAGSNGLASGNHPVEAAIAAICEVIERDAIALWQAGGIRRQAAGALDLASIDNAECRGLLEKYRAAGIAVRLWDVTSDLRIPAFLCQIRDTPGGEPGRLRRFHGSGCHPDETIALGRALTEAAQTRLTYIAGIRDDLPQSHYREPDNAEIADALLDALARQSEPVAFPRLPGLAGDDLRDDLRLLLDRLATAGIGRVVAVDLTREAFAIPVIRVVIPGLEGDPRHPGYRPGARARRAGTA
jgi:ribosomal protein S12 methylthiotransferase accessory factor